MSFFGINLASRALRAHQRSLEVTGQNIANVNTPEDWARVRERIAGTARA